MHHNNKGNAAGLGILLAAASLSTVAPAFGQEAPLAWDATRYFQYNIEKVIPSGNSVKVIFSVSNPSNPAAPFWDIKNDAPFKAGPSSSRLAIDIGWDPADYTNTGGSTGSLNPVSSGFQGGAGAALPVSVNALTTSQACTAATCPGVPSAGRYFVTATINPLAFPAGRIPATGVVAFEGHPACTSALTGCPPPTVINGVATPSNIPVKSVFTYFSLNGKAVAPRRQVVDIAKCKVCHDNRQHGDTVVPRLGLHGGNRNEELGVCVICHNPDQTDIPYRSTGAEVSIDFKRMVHSIHSGGFRRTPFSVVGFRGQVFDFSAVRFPAELSNCLNCHIDQNGKGTFELPLQNTVLGSTINTRSTPAQVAGTTGLIDVDPNNDLKITPTAATCSGCHDSAEVQNHMIRTGGASFATLQQNIVPGVTERCANCHGAGRSEDVRRVHEVRSASGTPSRGDN
jgi:OmcA/MtrC family decaheme c-type cytochrome